tara:strand:+ start:1879 stop:2598 length:720 start_codon:yes stop_codon:yes gene_type:complete
MKLGVLISIINIYIATSDAFNIIPIYNLNKKYILKLHCNNNDKNAIITDMSNNGIIKNLEKSLINNKKIPNIIKIMIKNTDCKEAELKHGRIAMLAAIGWPISEVYHNQIANSLQMESILTKYDTLPSFLNGGMEKINPIFYFIVIILASIIELISMIELISYEKSKEIFIYDPMNIYVNKTDFEQKILKIRERHLGRYAMISVTWYSYSEYVSNIPIIYDVPYLFVYIILFILIDIFT